MSSVYRFQCQSPAMFKDTISNRNIAETSATFCSQFDASGAVTMIGGLRFIQLPGAIQYTSFIITTYITIADRHIFRILKAS